MITDRKEIDGSVHPPALWALGPPLCVARPEALQLGQAGSMPGNEGRLGNRRKNRELRMEKSPAAKINKQTSK